MNNSKNKILIVAGGTGGHIFPAIAMGQNNLKDCEVKYICGSRDLEQEIYKASGINPEILKIPGSPFGVKNPFKIISRCFNILRAFSQADKIIKSFKPDKIFLFGGYISFVPLVIALDKKIPVVIHEQNAVAGRVTRFAEKLGVKILTGWPNCKGIKNFEYYGIPTREIIKIDKNTALEKLNLKLDPNKKIIGIAGGSLGSGPLSKLLKNTAELCKNYEFVFLSSKEIYNENNTHFLKSVWNINYFYSICDVLVCRSGGSTLAEALKLKIPTITIFWPGAADNHQEYNAKEFIKLAKNSYMFNQNDSAENLAKIILKM